jgi:hypothetical protein
MPSSTAGGVTGVIEIGGAHGSSAANTISTFFSSLGTGAVIFAVQFLLFLLIKDKLPRI